MRCRLCGGNCYEKFNGVILEKYNIKYYLCGSCGLLQTEKPYWLEEAYQKPINDTDVGLVNRNVTLASRISVILYFLFDRKGKYLDYGGGYGLFVRLMRDKGFDFYWYDPYTKNLFASGWEYRKGRKVEAITAFELLEHLVNPREEIERMMKFSDSIIFSTNLINIDVDTPVNWWYFAREHGQHIAFYSIGTLQYIANKYNFNLYTNKKNLHILTKRKFNRYIVRVLMILSKYNFFQSLVDLPSKINSDAKLIKDRNERK